MHELGLLDGCLVIAWEGTDGAGKTTLLRLVAKRLRSMGFKVSSYKTPSGTATGRFAKRHGNRRGVDPLVRMLLFLANTIDDSPLIVEEVRKSSPDFFFIDRYYLCSLVYGLALNRLAEEAAREVSIGGLVRLLRSLGGKRVIEPDLHLIIDVDEDERRRRTAAKRSIDKSYENDTRLQEVVRELYEDYRREDPERAIWIMNEKNRLSETADLIIDKLLSLRRELLR